MKRFSDEAEYALRTAGWQPGRQVDAEQWRRSLERSGFHSNGAAERFLSEFGGLNVNVSGPGISVARTPFEFDPMVADGEDDRFSDWGDEIGETIFPLGELDHGRFFLGMSESGRVYLVSDWLASFGTGDEALERLIRGIAADVIQE
ncbi:SUKH-3 domain-containing protein [Kitasatospora cineracea]|uniref:SUKH-3 domain-containing protein n=1 Tax=Kitasatospora cineracea TaxID=88074 RepID=UPI0036AA61EE